jgi:hypothetical protein
MAPARASGDILKNGTAVVTKFVVPLMFAPPLVCACTSDETNPTKSENAIEANCFAIPLLL